MPYFNLKPVTGAAFSLARYKIELSFFKDLNKILVDFHQQRIFKLWKGYQLIAVDGSTVSLPPSSQIKEYFGIYSQKGNGVKTCMAQILFLYDVCSEFVIAGKISKTEVSEKVQFRSCLAELPQSKSIFILDRGFGYFNTCKELILQQRDFCIRLSAEQSLFAKSALKNSINDLVIDWNPSEREKSTCLRHGIDYEPIKIRITKIQLKTGEIELLASSLLDIGKFALTDINNLYRLRWGVEEGFKKLKPKMKIEQFGSRKPQGIFQEFEAHLFMMNMVSILGDQAEDEIEKKCRNRKLNYKYNWQNAFRWVRYNMLQLIGYKDIENLILKLKELITRSVIPIKPDRSFERITYKKRKNRLHQTYK